jgi:hypothetical protein
MRIANRQFDARVDVEVPAGTSPRALINTIEYALDGVLSNVNREFDNAVSVTFEVMKRERIRVANRQFDARVSMEVPAGTWHMDLIDMIEYALAGVLGNINREFDNAVSVTLEVTKTEPELAVD